MKNLLAKHINALTDHNNLIKCRMMLFGAFYIDKLIKSSASQ